MAVRDLPKCAISTSQRGMWSMLIFLKTIIQGYQIRVCKTRNLFLNGTTGPVLAAWNGRKLTLLLQSQVLLLV